MEVERERGGGLVGNLYNGLAGIHSVRKTSAFPFDRIFPPFETTTKFIWSVLSEPSLNRSESSEIFNETCPD